MSLTNYYEAKVLNHINGVAVLTPEAHLHFGLSTSTPAEDGTNITEPTGNNYARVQKTNSSALWGAASGGAADNIDAVTFPQASGNWGTCTHLVAWDADETHPIWFAPLSVQKTVSDGDTLSFAAGDIDETLD